MKLAMSLIHHPISQSVIVVISVDIAGNGMALVTVGEAAGRLKVSTQTVKRRLKSGSLQGEQKDTPQGYIWLVNIPEDEADTTSRNGDIPSDTSADTSKEMQRLDQMITMLEKELEYRGRQIENKDQQISELHVLLQQAQAALPAPKENHHSVWWRFWQR